MNVDGLRRQIRRMKAQLAAEDSPALRPGGGMRALREAMMAEAARRARDAGLTDEGASSGGHPHQPLPVTPEQAMMNLRAEILAEQARRAAWCAEKSLDERMKEPATYDEPDGGLGERGGAPASEEETEQCPAPAPETHSQDS